MLNRLKNAKAVALLVIGTSCFSGSVNAALLDNYYGNAFLYYEPIDYGTAALDMNFAVFDRTNGTAGDPWGTGINMIDANDPNGLKFNRGPGSSAFQDTENFLYLYQLAYDGPYGIALTLEIPTKFATSWGTLSGQNGQNTSFLNPSFDYGEEKARIFPGGGAEVIVGGPGGAGQNGIKRITRFSNSYGYRSVNVEARLSPNVFTNVFGFTSQISPMGLNSSLPQLEGTLRVDFLDPYAEATDVSVGVSGFATTIPEPASLCLLGIGLAGLTYLSKRNKTKRFLR